MLRTILLNTMLISLCCLCGCGYRMGQITNPRLKNPAIEVKNRTEYAGLSQWTRINFQRNLFQQSGLKVAIKENADSLVIAEVVSATFGAATSRRLTEAERDDRQDRYSNDYSSSSYLGTVVIKFKVLSNNNDHEEIIPERNVEGTAYVPYTPDITVAQNTAFKAAIEQAVEQMINEISEAW